MANRAPDWLSQSGHDLDHARHALEAGDYDWACFAAHQSAEKAATSLIFGLNGEAWGHAVVRLLEDLQEHLDLNDELFDAARRLDEHYIPTRYPDGFDTGAPFDYYTEAEAQQALQDAQRIHRTAEQSLP